VDAIGAYREIGPYLASIGEAQYDFIFAVLHHGETPTEFDYLWRNDGGQCRMQIAPMHQEVWRAIPFFSSDAERIFKTHLARVEVSIFPRAGLEGDRSETILKIKGADNLYGVRTHLNAGADTREMRRLLVNFGLQTRLLKRCRSCEATDPGANDRDAR
jgi:hypothetical protein